MSKRLPILGLLLWLVACAFAQTSTDQNEGTRLEYDATNAIWRFKWWGKSGRTYFIQHSEDLRLWNWVPVVEPGDDSIKEWGFTTTGTKFFARLQYSTAGTTNAEGDDFDFDGVPNLYEVQHGNNPFAIEDSDGDGLPDGWLAFHANTFAIYPPSRLTASLSRNQTAPGKIYLNNDTDLAVNYSVAVSGNSGPSYSAQDSVGGSVVYDWQDIAATGTRLNAISNAWSGHETVNIVFSFPFYGQNYSQVAVSVNGLLTFSTPTYDDSFYPIPSYAYGPSNLIAPFWTDLETVTSGDIYFKQESDRLVIQYQNVKRAYNEGACTFQVILYSTGRIKFQYQSMSGLTSYATVGIEDATRTLGLQLGYYSAYVSNGKAVEIAPAADFFTISPVSGTVGARSRSILDGVFRSLQLPFGNYTANVTVTGGAAGPVSIAANLTVKNVPSVVAVVYPTNQEKLLEGQPLTISAAATDVDSQIVKVEFFDNGTKLGEDEYSYFQYAWASPPAGPHSLTAIATDVYGAVAVSPPVYLNVLPDSDRDGMDDTWEATFGLNTARDDSMEDFDGDRIPNVFEYRRETLPNDATSVPASDFIVNPATGAGNSTGNTFSTISEAVAAANQSQWNPATQASTYPNAYSVIAVKAGVYAESVYLSSVPTLLLGELGAPEGQAEIRASSGDAVLLNSASALDGFVISHAPGKDGGGVYSATWNGSRSRLLSNCIIRGNKAYYGGAIYNDGNSILRLAHCTIFGNKADSQGGAIYNAYTATIQLVNCVIWGNTGTATQEIYREPYGQGAPLSGGATSIIKGGEQGGIDQNPLLNASGYLLAASPAINRPGVVLAKVAKVDINGERRDQNGTPDLGADEYRDDNGINDGDGLPDWAELAGASSPTDDADGDGIANLAEYQAGLNPKWNDTDRDGLSDGAEINTYTSDPLSSDTDLDGLADGAEVATGTLVLVPDSDGDGLIDGYEVLIGTNPTLTDSDEDGMPDGWEDSRSLDPNINDAGLDPDRDELSNLAEFQRGTEPWDFDFDNDGLGDGYEVRYASLNPLVYNAPTSDGDSDGMGLLFEGIYGFNPEVADGSGDLDGDGLTNAQEYTFGSDPQLVDTDGDDLHDAQEQARGTDPWMWDTDYDGLSDGYEVSVGLNPLVANSSNTDTDGDGLKDIDEHKNGSNPTVPDTDGDGTADGAEVQNGADPTHPDDNGQAPPPERKFKVAFEIASGGKTVTASCAACHHLQVQVGPKTASTGEAVELEKGRSYEIKLKDKPETWRPAGQEPPHDDTAFYTLVAQAVDGQTVTPSSDNKHVIAEKDQIVQYLIDNDSGLLTDNKPWSNSTLQQKAELASVEIVPDDNMVDVVGDMVKSNKGETGEKHFVSPKESTDIPDDYVVFKVKGISQTAFDRLLEWGTEGEAVSGDTMKRKVKRDVVNKTTIRLKTKGASGREIAKLNVWVVWSTGSVVYTPTPVYDPTANVSLVDGTTGGRVSFIASDSITDPMVFKFRIFPIGLFDLAADIPDLRGPKETDPPGGEAPLAPGKQLSTGAAKKWDISRAIKVTLVNPNIPRAKFPASSVLPDNPAILAGQPQNGVVLLFPSDPLIGTDDWLDGSISVDPYSEFVSQDIPPLSHEIGDVTSSDRPSSSISDYLSAGGYYEERNDFREFLRLNLGTKWYGVSHFLEWHFILRVRSSGGVLLDDGSEIGRPPL